jgi:hypothetical protein
MFKKQNLLHLQYLNTREDVGSRGVFEASVSATKYRGINPLRSKLTGFLLLYLPDQYSRPCHPMIITVEYTEQSSAYWNKTIVNRRHRLKD